MNADLHLFEDKYVCGMQKKTHALDPMLLFVTLLFHCVMVLEPPGQVTGAVVRLPGFFCLLLMEGHWEWLVEVQRKLIGIQGDGSGKGHDGHYLLPGSW